MHFHNGNLKNTLTFHNSECIQEFVYVTNLSEDHYLFQKDPYLFVNSDGIILGLDQQTPSIHLFNQHHELLDTFLFTFITTCETLASNQQPQVEKQTSQPNDIVFLIPIVCLFLLIMIFRKKGKHHEI